MRKEKSDLRLRELKKGTKVRIGDFVGEFLGIDGMYARWKGENVELVIMGHANQNVSEYGEIVED